MSNPVIVSDDGFSHGGGGGFTQSRVKVTPGDMLIIYVGSGGKFNPLDYKTAGESGFNKGGQGGTSVMGPNAGGGGGYSAVLRSNGDRIAAAGGGGGGGSTDYCCAHGGPGSGSTGATGSSPHTPVWIGSDTTVSDIVRQEFTPADCESADCIDPRDQSGLPAFHMHFDRGFAPNASYDETCTGGKGGGFMLAGEPGLSSRYSVYDDDIRVGALIGGSGTGGKGADGKEAGGGGGSGFMGGSGGGSGVGM